MKKTVKRKPCRQLFGGSTPIQKLTHIVKEKKKMFIALIFIAIPLILWIAWDNSALMVSQYTLSSPRLPEAFSGFRIAQISDLHNTEFGEGNERLLTLLESTEPDVILITGDLLDSRRTSIPVALSFAEEAVNIAPTYYITGNHESRIAARDPEGFGKYEADLEKIGVQILRNRSTALEKDGTFIRFIGLDDPDFYENPYLETDGEEMLLSKLEELMEPPSVQEENQNQDQDQNQNQNQKAASAEPYTILLSHRPELFESYQKYPVDLIFSGHTHGGQFRLPFFGGVLAPHQGFFPIYDGGLFTEETGDAEGADSISANAPLDNQTKNQVKTQTSEAQPEPAEMQTQAGNEIAAITSQMIVSRGLGNSLFPFRINNRPEIVLVELKKQ